MGKSSEKRKSSSLDDTTEGQDSKELWQEKIKYVNVIAQPLAPRKLTKKLYKTLKKGSKKKQLRKGVREVMKYIRKGEKGMVLMAGDVSPIDVICHMPLVCEEEGLPYCYIPSKEDLGLACGSNRQTCMVMVKPNEDYQELYDECVEQVKSLPSPI